MSSLRVPFDIVKDETPGSIRKLYLINGARRFFSRARLHCRGQVCEDMSQYNRAHTLVNLFKKFRSHKT